MSEPSIENTFDTLYGLDITDIQPGLMSGKVEVLDKIKQPFGLVHGGVYTAIAESLASVGTWFGVKDDGKIAVGLNNNTSFLRPVRSGTLYAVAKAVHSGRTTWIWDVEFHNGEPDKLCAVSRMTIAVREERQLA